jgi:hypothetical protein
MCEGGWKYAQRAYDRAFTPMYNIYVQVRVVHTRPVTQMHSRLLLTSSPLIGRN